MSTQAQQPTQALAKFETSPLILKMAAEWQINPATMISTLKATIFPQVDRDKKPVVVSNEQVIAFLQVCSEYKLNPWVKEIYAFPTKGGGIVPMVPIDGWLNIVNRNPQMDGLDFVDEWEMTPEGARKGNIPFSTTCIIYRKDRSHPTKVTEYFHECNQPGKEPWQKWPARMLRHKAMIQCARVAFSLSGIYDPDEAERIAETGDDKTPITRPTRASAGPATIDAQPTSSAQPSGQQKGAAAAVSTPSTEGASNRGSTAQHQPAPASSGCFCSCCKNGTCVCLNKDEFDRCGCTPCKNAVATPVEVKKEEPRPTEDSVDAGTSTEQASDVAPGNQPSGSDLFPQQGQAKKPEGPYITGKQVQKLIISAKASGVEIKKDSHDDVIHVGLQQRWNISSLTEIPVSLYDEILKWASNAGPVKVNAK